MEILVPTEKKKIKTVVKWIDRFCKSEWKRKVNPLPHMPVLESSSLAASKNMDKWGTII